MLPLESRIQVTGAVNKSVCEFCLFFGILLTKHVSQMQIKRVLELSLSFRGGLPTLFYSVPLPFLVQPKLIKKKKPYGKICGWWRGRVEEAVSDSNSIAVMGRIRDISRLWSEGLHEQKTVDGVFALKVLQLLLDMLYVSLGFLMLLTGPAEFVWRSSFLACSILQWPSSVTENLSFELNVLSDIAWWRDNQKCKLSRAGNTQK